MKEEKVMRKMRVIAMLMAAVLAVAGLSGCGENQASGESSVAESISSAGTEQENQTGEVSAVDTSEK